MCINWSVSPELHWILSVQREWRAVSTFPYWSGRCARTSYEYITTNTATLSEPVPRQTWLAFKMWTRCNVTLLHVLQPWTPCQPVPATATRQQRVLPNWMLPLKSLNSNAKQNWLQVCLRFTGVMEHPSLCEASWDGGCLSFLIRDSGILIKRKSDVLPATFLSLKQMLLNKLLVYFVRPSITMQQTR